MRAPHSAHHVPVSARRSRANQHIVGLGPEGDYLPMLWETFRHSSPRTKWIDFKYQMGRSPWGLNKRLVLKKAQLARLLRAYEHALGRVIVTST